MMVRADGSQESKDLTKGLPNSGFPTWSPDGKKIIYRVWGAGEYGLRVLNLEDGSTKTLTTELDNFPAYSPGGDLLTFTRRDAKTLDYDIFTMRPDGTDVKRLTTTPGNDSHSSWSPDGKYSRCVQRALRIQRRGSAVRQFLPTLRTNFHHEGGWFRSARAHL